MVKRPGVVYNDKAGSSHDVVLVPEPPRDVLPPETEEMKRIRFAKEREEAARRVQVTRDHVVEEGRRAETVEFDRDGNPVDRDLDDDGFVDSDLNDDWDLDNDGVDDDGRTDRGLDGVDRGLDGNLDRNLSRDQGLNLNRGLAQDFDQNKDLNPDLNQDGVLDENRTGVHDNWPLLNDPINKLPGVPVEKPFEPLVNTPLKLNTPAIRTDMPLTNFPLETPLTNDELLRKNPDYPLDKTETVFPEDQAEKDRLAQVEKDRKVEADRKAEVERKRLAKLNKK